MVWYQRYYKKYTSNQAVRTKPKAFGIQKGTILAKEIQKKRGRIRMAKVRTLNREIRVKIAERQYEFLENRIRELGLSSMAELMRWYIANDIVKTEQPDQSKKERISLEGVISGSTVTEEDFEEAKKIWIPKSL